MSGGARGRVVPPSLSQSDSREEVEGGGAWREEAGGGAGLGARAQQQCLIVSRWVGFKL